MNESARVAAYVLAGGRSRRLGRDKAQVMIAGRPALDHQIAVVSALSKGEVVVVGGEEGRATRGALHIADIGGRQGPLDGLVTALEHAVVSHGHDSLALVIAVDLWNLTSGVLEQLVEIGADPELRDEVDVVHLCAEDEHGVNRDQPLCALWQVSRCRSILSAAFARNERSVVAAWGGLRRRAVKVSGTVLVNINTPDDLQRWESARSPG